MYFKSILNIRNTFIVFLIIAILCSVASVSAADPQMNNEQAADIAAGNNITAIDAVNATADDAAIANGTANAGIDTSDSIISNYTMLPEIAEDPVFKYLRLPEDSDAHQSEINKAIIMEIIKHCDPIVYYIIKALEDIPTPHEPTFYLNFTQPNESIEDDFEIYKEYSIINHTDYSDWFDWLLDLVDDYNKFINEMDLVWSDGLLYDWVKAYNAVFNITPTATIIVDHDINAFIDSFKALIDYLINLLKGFDPIIETTFRPVI